MKNQEKFTRIVEWLYVNDGMFKSKNEWRENFIGMLKSLFGDEGNYAMGGQLGVDLPHCSCNMTTSSYCPIHKTRL